jgi:hypothetical protein
MNFYLTIEHLKGLEKIIGRIKEHLLYLSNPSNNCEV